MAHRTVSRITEKFNALRKKGKKAFIPYLMAGDPSPRKTIELVRLLEECGADIIELGVPFSDPVADGPVIQRAAERALAQGVTLREVLSLVGEIRKSTEIPIVLMTYYNPVFKLGVEKFAAMAAGAGVDGAIVPDLPPDEAGDLIGYAKKHGLDTVFLFAPTSTQKRIRLVAKASSGFIYYVSLTGITGSKLTIGPEQRASVEAARAITRKPIAVGFGVSTPEEAAAVAGIADGVIVGSAIVRMVGDKALKDYLLSMRAAI